MKKEKCDETLIKMRFVHKILVMIVEDIYVCGVGVYLAVQARGLNPVRNVNRVYACITVVACFLQFVVDVNLHRLDDEHY